MKKTNAVILLVASLFVSVAMGQSLELGSPFGSNMVLQRQANAAIWGKAKPGAKVSVSVSWNTDVYQAEADREGRWITRIKTPEAGGPHSLVVKSVGEKIELKNVLSGEVWICSGQSNMQWKMRGFGKDHWKTDVEQADYPEIRYCRVSQVMAVEGQDAVRADWTSCSPGTAYDYSAVAFFFGRELYEELGVPIGLVSVNWGGSSAQAWVSSDVLKEEFPEFSEKQDTYPQMMKEHGALYLGGKKNPEGVKLNQTDPSVLFNGMIKPLIPFTMRGVIWYQGESNVKNPVQYRTLFPALIKDWRTQWGSGDFPFYYVQIAPWTYKTNPMSAAYLREAQTMALSVPNTGMAVTMDVGQVDDIHPRVKKPVAHRLALLALTKDYGKTGLVYSGPLYKAFKVEGNRIRLTFNHIGGGLVSSDGEALTHFTIAGKDKQFVEAEAVIDGKTIVVCAKDVKKPVAVRYGWGSADIPNLSNKEGLPASSFRTDDWPIED